MPQALSVCDLHIFQCWLSSAGKRQNKNIQGSILFHNSPEATHWQECGHQRMLITHWGFVKIHECSVKEFSVRTFILWMSWKLRKIHWLTHKRQCPTVDSCIVLKLAVAEGDCKFGLRRDDSVFYCQTGKPLAFISSQLQDGKHEGMRMRKIVGTSRQNQD